MKIRAILIAMQQKLGAMLKSFAFSKPSEAKPSETWFGKAIKFRRAGNFEEAIKCCAEAAHLKPGYGYIYTIWGSVIFDLAELRQDEALYCEAINKYEEGDSREPYESSYDYEGWGDAIFGLAKLRQDEALYYKAIDKYYMAATMDTYYHLYNLLFNFDKWKDALTALANIKDKNEELFLEKLEEYKKEFEDISTSSERSER